MNENAIFAELPREYIEKYLPNDINEDCHLISTLQDKNIYAIDIRVGVNESRWQVKLFKLNDHVSLSRGLPIIENFGFKLLDEKPFFLELHDKTIHICDFGVEISDILKDKIHDIALIEKLKLAIIDAFDRRAESDGLNKLVLYAGLTGREVSMMRAIVKYIVQTSVTFSLKYLIDCFVKYYEFSAKLIELINTKFSLINDMETDELFKILKKSLRNVNNLAEDQILQTAISIADSMVRTNFFQNKSYISFKLASEKVLNLPLPLPMYEIYVYSMRFEAIHLRASKVARGGLRWSDRPEDFRTEVLGLVKTQIIKNAVIIPSGSKGGFICKKLTTDKTKDQEEGINCYKQFVSALIELTDNVLDGKVIPPENTRCYDEYDPYLVVAADKGTASFSDIANEISINKRFWLHDAFASGGSAGYDHKKLGITAKGAWESISNHLRHLQHNGVITTVGIGDMAGDVFGNGLILSNNIKLVAAFNHIHIFLDPNPDVIASFNERLRLFQMPTSNWTDYKLISDGGGVFSRSDKSINISSQVKAVLNIAENELSPNDLIKAILQAECDLIYNGGIGTYIKSSKESHQDAHDKSNDKVRVDANQLKAKVIAEGGNLGLTQLARVEFAKLGGQIYTDAIDNSAGVDCSDHEVNIKILFSAVMNELHTSIDNRNNDLVSMESEVVKLVLRDNYLQTIALRLASYRANYTMPNHHAFIKQLESSKLLDRKVEGLPDDNEIKERIKQNNGLTIPELAVLMAYSKISLKAKLSKEELHEFTSLLHEYFPVYLANEKYSKYIENHYLKNEIIISQIANLVVNRAGMTFVMRFIDEFNLPVGIIIKAWWISYHLLNAPVLYSQIEELDKIISWNTQIKLFFSVEKSVERLCRWLLRYVKDYSNCQSIIDKFKPHILAIEQNISTILKTNEYDDIATEEISLIENKTPVKLAQLISRLHYLPQVMDIVILSSEHNLEYEYIARNYFLAGRLLYIDFLRKAVLNLPRENKWQARTRSALLTNIYKLYRGVMLEIIQKHNGDSLLWIEKNTGKLNKLHDIINELLTYNVFDLTMLYAVSNDFLIILNIG